ncbi:hypothetical protein [Ensifer aridi]|uniref:hypothetical protein n=1 Tax=Ensifer aridi TaxID=1708715 RepID=UPI000A122642|nr:hypothetical protein [Ensifer aridi]
MADDRKTAGFIGAARKRTEAKLNQIEAEMDRLRRRVLSGELDQNFMDEGKGALPSPRRLCVDAGVGEYFLYGQKHKDTTAKVVDDFLVEMLSVLRRRCDRPDEPATSTDAEELKRLRLKYQKLADHAHIWHQRMRAMRHEIRMLKQAHRPTVVPINKPDRR